MAPTPALAPTPTPLHETLLHAAPCSGVEGALEAGPGAGPGSGRRWAYGLPGLLVVSAWLLYHLVVLLVSNGPGQELAKPFQAGVLTPIHGHAYFRGTRNDQSWAMFAPNPDRTNNFIKVFVTDGEGEVWDFGQDVWGQDRYPYGWYDRRGKVNRNLDGKKHYQRMYGAWVCREWERQHGGERARTVRFVKRWTEVPEPRAVIDAGGWDAWAAPFKTFEQETIHCAKVEQGTLPNALRARYGLPAIDEAREFRPVTIDGWWTPPPA